MSLWGEVLPAWQPPTPSGKGIRIIVRGSIGPLGRRNNPEHIEVYDGGQYLTITGHHVRGTPKVIRTRTKKCSDLHEKYLATQITNAMKNKQNLMKWVVYKTQPSKLF